MPHSTYTGPLRGKSHIGGPNEFLVHHHQPGLVAEIVGVAPAVGLGVLVRALGEPVEDGSWRTSARRAERPSNHAPEVEAEQPALVM